MESIKGTGVALVTPFLADGNLDIEGLKRLVRHVTEGGVDFLVVLGTTGESATLAEVEKNTVIQTIIDENDGKLPIVLGCGGNNTAAICKQIAEYSTQFKPDAFLSVSPYYNKPTQEGIYRHFLAVSAATSLPIILYNVPGRTSSNMLPETVLRIASNCNNIVAIKEASGNIAQGMEIIQNCGQSFLVLSGDDNLTLPMIASGYSGVISVMANAMPHAFSQIAKNALDENYKTAKEFHYEILDLMNLNFVEGNPAGVKALLKELGVCETTVRLPLVEASEQLQKQIADALKNCLKTST